MAVAPAKPFLASGFARKARRSFRTRRLRPRSATRTAPRPASPDSAGHKSPITSTSRYDVWEFERVDLYYIHEFDRVTPLEETLEAMADAVRAGKIDRLGVSNATLSDVEAVRNIAGDSLGSRFEYLQNEYNLLATGDAEALIPYCAAHALRYTAFSPLAGGFLTGKYRPGEKPPSGSRLANAPEVCAGYLSDQSFAAIEQLRRTADERQETMAEAALRFVLDTLGVDSLIIAPRRIEHFASFGLLQFLPR